jgi:hypothetical protein
LQRDEELILADYLADWDAAWKAFEIARAAVLGEDDGAALAKIVDTTTSPLAAVLAKRGARAALEKLEPGLAATIEKVSTEFAIVSSLAAENRRLIKKIVAGREVIENLEKAQKAAIDRRDERMFGHGALRRRSQRFASAHLRKSYGPGANSLPPAS